MPRKRSKSGFWYFMLDWKKSQELKGRVFPNGFDDVRTDPECDDAWRALSDQQKISYTSRSKRGNNNAPKEKMNSLGESIRMTREKEQRELDFKLNMESHIRHTVFTAKKYNAIPTLKFFFLHMNWYYMREPDTGPVDFCPAEFAIAEFSLVKGVTDYYHEIIRTNLHLGYAREAMETSEKTHKLNWDLAIGEDDWSRIYEKFFNYIKSRTDNDDIPPIYTSEKIVHVIPSLLRRMTAQVNASPNDFLIYTVEKLFENVLRGVNEFADSNVPGLIAKTAFAREPFAYTPNIECDYHRTQDGTSQYCSLSIVRQWGFIFSDHCCVPMKIDMIPGIHCPELVDVIFSGTSCCGETVVSLTNDRSPSVLSATGVSEAHRIRVSERNRDDRKRTLYLPRNIEIIERSRMMDGELQTERKIEPARVSRFELPRNIEIIERLRMMDGELQTEGKSEPARVTGHVRMPVRPLRKPKTVSEAVKGTSPDSRLFDRADFSVIVGSG